MSITILIICTITGFYIFFKSRPKLLAMVGERGEIEFWDARPDSESRIPQIKEAYEMVKPKLNQTHEGQIKKRGWRPSSVITTTYIVEDGEWFYIFSDNYPYKAPGVEVPSKYKNGAIHFNQLTKAFKFE
jgi:hypothetical protein